VSAGCALCDGLEHAVERGALWTLALNRNQNLLGKCMLVLNRHAESVASLTPEEWGDLHRWTVRATGALDKLFAPDLYNLAFLMNQDAHVHLHLVPRYAALREWAGETYDDPHYGTLFGTEQRLAPAEMLRLLEEELRGILYRDGRID
jgi:diadenosine tetraphosphate (Ap4A) HIT family hydrolase